MVHLNKVSDDERLETLNASIVSLYQGGIRDFEIYPSRLIQYRFQARFFKFIEVHLVNAFAQIASVG